jgi:hypothetical protein
MINKLIIITDMRGRECWLALEMGWLSIRGASLALAVPEVMLHALDWFGAAGTHSRGSVNVVQANPEDPLTPVIALNLMQGRMLPSGARRCVLIPPVLLPEHKAHLRVACLAHTPLVAELAHGADVWVHAYPLRVRAWERSIVWAADAAGQILVASPSVSTALAPGDSEGGAVLARVGWRRAGCSGWLRRERLPALVLWLLRRRLRWVLSVEAAASRAPQAAILLHAHLEARGEPGERLLVADRATLFLELVDHAQHAVRPLQQRRRVLLRLAGGVDEYEELRLQPLAEAALVLLRLEDGLNVGAPLAREVREAKHEPLGLQPRDQELEDGLPLCMDFLLRALARGHGELGKGKAQRVRPSCTNLVRRNRSTLPSPHVSTPILTYPRQHSVCFQSETLAAAGRAIMGSSRPLIGFSEAMDT